MSWHITGFDKESRRLVLDETLPADTTEADAARIVGAYPELMFGEFPVPEFSAAAVMQRYGISLNFDVANYFLGYATD